MGLAARIRDRFIETDPEGPPPLTAGSVAAVTSADTGTDSHSAPGDAEPGPVNLNGAEPSAAGAGAGAGATSPTDRYVPHGLQVAASWSWRLLLVAAAVYGISWVFAHLSEVVVPMAVAILLAALLAPVADRLRSWGLPPSLATTLTLLGGLALIAGSLTLIISQIVGQAAVLSSNLGTTLDGLVAYLRDGPLQISAQYLNPDLWADRLRDLLAESQGAVAEYAAEFGAQLGHLLAGVFIVLFAVFYFLYDGRGIFTFLLKFFPREVQGKVDHAAAKGWVSLSHYVRATILVALSNGIGVLIGALLVGVPVAPALAALVFIGSFVPLAGAFVSGSVSVAVAFVALGWAQALMMLGILILVVQIEGHILQPLLLGHAVKLHPLAVLLAIAIGIILGGIVGALIAVPILAFGKSFVQYLMGASDPPAIRLRWPVPGRPGHRHGSRPLADGVRRA